MIIIYREPIRISRGKIFDVVFSSPAMYVKGFNFKIKGFNFKIKIKDTKSTEYESCSLWFNIIILIILFNVQDWRLPDLESLLYMKTSLDFIIATFYCFS